MESDAEQARSPTDVENDERHPLLDPGDVTKFPKAPITEFITEANFVFIPISFCLWYFLDRLYCIIPLYAKLIMLLIPIFFAFDWRKSPEAILVLLIHGIIILPLFGSLFIAPGGLLFFLAYLLGMSSCLWFYAFPVTFIILCLSFPLTIIGIAVTRDLKGPYLGIEIIRSYFKNTLSETDILPAHEVWLFGGLGFIFAHKELLLATASALLYSSGGKTLFISILSLTSILYLGFIIYWLKNFWGMIPILGSFGIDEGTSLFQTNEGSFLLLFSGLRYSSGSWTDRRLSNWRLRNIDLLEYRALREEQLEEQSEIRLLRLHPGNESRGGIISCDLTSIPLDEADAYEAISHRWSSDGNVFIIVNGQRATVSCSIYAMLKNLRYPDSSRYLWIDSLCINQLDNAEKSFQVAIMGKIYQKATQVIAWLGDDPACTSAISTLHSLASKFSNSTEEEALILLQSEREQLVGQRYHNKWRAVAELYRKEWFSRIWIIQEIALAQKVLVKAGQREEIDWEHLASVTSVMRGAGFLPFITSHLAPPESSESEKGFHLLLMMEEIRSQFSQQPEGLDLFWAVQSTPIFKCTYFRDRFYGLLGICTSNIRNAVNINYASSRKRVLLNVARLFHFQAPGIKMSLCEAGLGWSGDLKRHNGGISWVVDGRSLNPIPVDMYATANHLEPDVEESISRHRNILRVRGTKLDVIEKTSLDWQLEVENLNRAQFNTVEKKLCALLDEGLELAREATQDGEAAAEKLLWNVIFRQYVEELTPIPHTSFDIFKSFWTRLNENRQDQNHYRLQNSGMRDDYLGVASAIINSLITIKGGRLCLTKDGHFGFFPPETIEGDIVAVIFGATTPFLVRPLTTPDEEAMATASVARENSKGKGKEAQTEDDMAKCENTDGLSNGTEYYHQLIGACYIQGYMLGELKNLDLEPEDILLV